MEVISKQQPTWATYCIKSIEKHPTLNKWKIPMNVSAVNWESIIAEIDCEQVVELSSDWKPVLSNINKNNYKKWQQIIKKIKIIFLS